MARKKLTGFGKKIMRIAEDRRDIYNWDQLQRALEGRGLNLSRQHMSNYACGVSLATPEFVRHFADEMELDEEERAALAESWAFEQEHPDKERFRTDIYREAESLGWSREERRQNAYRHIFGK